MDCTKCGRWFPKGTAFDNHECVPPLRHQEEVKLQSEKTGTGIYFPKPDPNFYVKRWQIRATESLLSLAERKPVNILLTGPTGGGKTSFTEHVAGLTGRPYFAINCGVMQEPREWFGEMLFRPGIGTYYQESTFVEALGTPKCIICLDELNRSENPKVTNAIMDLLSEARSTWVDVIKKRFRVAEGVIFMATINEGGEYTGIDPLDLALRGRFHVLPMDYPSNEAMVKLLVAKSGLDSSQATDLVNVVSTGIKSNHVPTRSLIIAGEHISNGLTFQEALKLGFHGSLKPEVMTQLLQTAQVKIGESVPGDLQEEVRWASRN